MMHLSEYYEFLTVLNKHREKFFSEDTNKALRRLIDAVNYETDVIVEGIERDMHTED